MSSQPVNAAQRAVERAMQDLPPLPAVVTRVLQVTGDDYGSANEIERMVRTDQAIASKLLRVVNSPYYGLAGRVSNLSQAVVILGFHQVRNIVASLGALSLFESKPPRVQASLKRHWLHAFGAGACAQLIARNKRFAPHDQELAFVLGLLSNVGQVFLMSEFPAQYEQALRASVSTGRTVADMESTIFGLDHACIGRMLVDRWGLPVEVREPLGGHEGPFSAGTAPLAFLAHVADRVSWKLTEGHGIGGAIQGEEPAAWSWLAFEPSQVDSLEQEVRARIDAATEFLAPSSKAA